jgi:hypothetical protein
MKKPITIVLISISTLTIAGYLVWESDTFQKNVYPKRYWKKYWLSNINYLNNNIESNKYNINEAEIEIKRLSYENILNHDLEVFKNNKSALNLITDANNSLIYKWKTKIILSIDKIESEENELKISKKELSKYQ